MNYSISGIELLYLGKLTNRNKFFKLGFQVCKYIQSFSLGELTKVPGTF